MSATELEAFMSGAIDWQAFEEVTLSLLDARGGEPEMPRRTHGKGVRAKPQRQSVKVKPAKKAKAGR